MPVGNETAHLLDGLTVVGGIAIRTPGTAATAYLASSGGYVSDGSSFTPADLGFLAWSFDPNYAQGTTTLPTAGLVQVVRVRIPYALSVTNVHINVQTAGVTLTANQCLAGLYQNGALVGTTADQSTAWGSTGLKTMALTGGPYTVQAGVVYVAFFYNGTTGPILYRGASSGGAPNGLQTANYRFGTADSGRTTSLAATLGTVSNAGSAYWAAVS